MNDLLTWITHNASAIGAVATVASAVGAFVALLFISRQITTSRQTAACEFILNLSDKYQSPDLRDKRIRLAKHLLVTPEARAALAAPPRQDGEEHTPAEVAALTALRPYADPVLSDFERLGMMLRKGLVPRYFVWTGFFLRVTNYYELLQNYLTWVRREDAAYYIDFRYLYRQLRVYHARQSRPRLLRWLPVGRIRTRYTPDALRRFVVRECQIRIRPLQSEDIRDTLVPEALEERLLRYLRANCIIAVAEILSRGDPDHDFAGYVAAGIESDGTASAAGEIKELYVDHRFRGVGVGTRLCAYACNEISQWESGSCYVTVPEEDSPMTKFYLGQHFQIVDDGGRFVGKRLKRVLLPEKPADTPA